MNINNKKSILLGTACLLVVTLSPVQTAEAKIFKCVNKQGTVFYKDKPCPVYDKETEINAIKDPLNGYVPPAFVKDPVVVKKSVVVGGVSKNQLDSSKEKKPTDPLSTKRGSGSAGSTGSTGSTPQQNAHNGSEKRSPSTELSSEKRGSNQAPLPTIPLKVENKELIPR